MKPWIKFWTEIVDDPKMGQLSDRLWRRVGEMFAFAGKVDDGGLLPPVTDMAWTLHLTAEELTADLLALSKLDRPIVTKTDEGWVLRNFAKRQARMTDAERQRWHRDNECHEPVTIRDKNGHAVVQEEEEEEDPETEVDISSSSTAPAQKAIEAFLQARGGAIGPTDVDRIDLMVEKAGEHIAVLARGSPGADLSGDGWVAAAIEEAVQSQDGRGISLKYIEAILGRWIAQGFKSKQRQAHTTKGKHNGRDRTVSESNGATPETQSAVAEWLAAHPNAAGPQ